MNPLIKRYGTESRWVNYRKATVGGRITKVPYTASGRKASSVNSKDWSTYKESLKSSEDVGIVFTPDRLLLGIDIDHVVEQGEVVGEHKDAILTFISAADTYTEISPSNTGIHLFLELTQPVQLKANRSAPYEIYDHGRYFTFTGNVFGDEKDVRKVTPDEVENLLTIIGYPWAKKEQPLPQPEQTIPVEARLDDQEILSKMFSSKKGDDIQRLYEGDLSAYENDRSAADLALCSHLAFWAAKDESQIERIWTASPLAQRRKTQARKDYRDRTIKQAILSCKTVYEPPKTKVVRMEKSNPSLNLLYTVSQRGAITYIRNTENVCRILSRHSEFANRLRYDEFKGTYEVRNPIKQEWHTFDDADAIDIQTSISVLFPDDFGTVSKDMVFDAMVKVARENTIDSAHDFLKSLVWDKKDRIETWLSSVYGVEPDAYHKAVGANVLKGLVSRIARPGCKFDHVLVLEGPQGSRKSTSLAILGGDWHVETTMSTDSKDFFMQFQGKAIVEFSEGETLSRTEVKRMKAIITMPVDKYRPPYARTSQEFPRRCIFAMTTNQSEYLKDETGNRRWLPVEVKRDFADVEWLKENRNQLLAEAYYRVCQLGETSHEFPMEETLAAQDARRIRDANSDLIASWFHEKVTITQKMAGITTYMVYRDALHGGLSSKPMSKADEMNIAGILKNDLKLISNRKEFDGIRQTRWFLNEEEVQRQKNYKPTKTYEEERHAEIAKEDFGGF